MEFIPAISYLYQMEDDKNIAAEPDLEYNSYTYADYVNFTFDYMVELIRGRIYKMTPAPSPKHQLVIGNLFLQFRSKLHTDWCQVYLSPLDVILPIYNPRKDSPNTVVQPDLCIICDPAKIQETGCFGAPDLVIEVISPYTSKKDLTKKYDVYEEAGVREYWIVFPKDEIIATYGLVDSKFCRGETFVKPDLIHSTIFPDLGFSVQEIFD